LIQAILLIFEEEFGLSETESEESLNQDIFDFLLLSKIIKKKRERYILPRSTRCVEVCLFSEDRFSNVQFLESFRISRTSFYTLYALLRPFIQKQSSHFRDPTSPDRRLAIFLYHISHGASFRVISDQFACGKSTVCGIIADITEAILHHLTNRYISFSTSAEAMRSIEF
jgi:hypothetical protein